MVPQDVPIIWKTFGVLVLTILTDETHAQDAQKEKTGGDMSTDAILTIAITIPCALVVGALWCYCMSRVCGITHHSHHKPSRPSAKLSRDNLAYIDSASHGSPSPRDIIPGPARHHDMVLHRDLTPVEVEMDDELGLDIDMESDDDISIGSSPSTHHPDSC